MNTTMLVGIHGENETKEIKKNKITQKHPQVAQNRKKKEKNVCCFSFLFILLCLLLLIMNVLMLDRHSNFFI